MKTKHAASYSRLAHAIWLACLGSAVQPAIAQEQVEELTVTGTRLITSGVNTPTPVTAVTAADLQTMAPTTLIESLSQLPVFSNNLTSQQAVGGSVAPGGSNLNLRGLEARRTLVLLDGHRLGPSNKFGTVDVSVIPEMFVSSVEAVTGGASAAYGADAVAGVVNFRLDRNFTGTKYQFQGGATTHSDGGNYKAGVAYGTDIGESGHLIASLEYWKKNGIRSLESLQDRSDYLDLKAQVTNPDPVNGPNFLARPFVSPTNFTAGGVLLQPGSAVDHIEFLPDGSGNYQQLPFSGVGQLTGGCNYQARPSLEYGIDADYEVDTPADRGVLFAHYNHDLSERNSFYVETLLADSEQANVWQTAALLGPWGGRIYADNPYLPAALSQQLQNEGREFAGFGIFTPNLSGNPFEGGELIAKNRYGQFVGGFSHAMSDSFLGGGWLLDGYAQYAQNRQETVVPGGIRTDRLPIAMDAVTGPDGTPVCRVSLFNVGIFDDCVPINLLGGTASVTQAAADYVVDNGKIARGRTTENDVEVTLRGDLTEGSGVFGPITAAFGASWRQQTLTVGTVDPCDEFPCTPDNVLLSDQGLNPDGLRGVLPETSPGGIPGLRYVPPGFAGDSNSSTVLFSSQRAVQGGYSVREAFFEVGIPLLENGKLNLNEAFRWADYSGSGNTNAWKTGISYQATERFRIRATRSQDVRAPTLQERFESQRGGVNVRDPENLDAQGNPQLITTASFSGGNPNVGLEEAATSVLGFVYEPTERFSVTIDRYDVDLDGAIGQLTAQTIVNTCSASGGTSSLCQFVVRDGTGQINRVEALFINLSNMRITGVDLELNYSGIEVGDGTLSWRLLGSRLDENSILTPGSPRDDRAGDVGTEGLPKTKVTTSLRYARGPVSVFLQERYIGGGLNDKDLVESATRIPGAVTIDDNTIDSVLYTDLTFNYSGGSNAGTPWEAFFTVNNLFDEAPPDMYTVVGRAGVGGPNSFLYDTIGRRFVAGVRVNF